MANSDENKELFARLKKDLLNIDTVYWAENHLMLDGKPFRVRGNGYKPFSDVYRYVGIKAIEPTAKPLVIVAGRQVGKTTMACVLELYFMASGLFGTGDRPPIRVIHAFSSIRVSCRLF